MAVSVINQWSGSFAQPSSFQATPPALQSVVVQLVPATSVGGGTGTPAAGNWLVVLAGMNEQAAASGRTVGVKTDTHDYWRPGKVSAAAALTRASVWYTANTQRAPGYVYVSPDGAFDALSVLVLEVSGLGPWDTLSVTPAASYAAAATSLNLALAAPPAASAVIAAVCGDSTAAGQAFAPASWTALATVSAGNGTDHTCDCVLTSAYLPSTSSSVSVNGTAASAADLSGVIIGFQVSAPSPVPGGANPNWASRMILEAAFGSGFETPEDQMTWTVLNDSGAQGGTKRLWSWSDSGGVGYALGQLQSSAGTVECDNFDGALSPSNPAALFYSSAAGWSPLASFYDPLVAAGTPLAWWKLADAAGSGTAADSSGNGHAGTATSVTFGNASEAVSGNTSASFASASSSHILSSYNPALTAVTAEAWVNLGNLTQPTSFGRIIASSFTDSDSKGFELTLASGQAQLVVGNGTANAFARGGTIPPAGWTYLAGTYDGATIRLYVNGTQVASAPFSGSVPAGTAAGIGIGYGAAYAGDYFNGLISEAAVYGSALTAAQIAARYTAGPSGTGVPVRLRCALGTIKGTTYNRWYAITRNALKWPEKRTSRSLRGYVPLSLTDIWSVVSGSCSTPYRGEVYQDSPYAWWAMDDQALSGGVQPTTLRNSASGNTAVLTIQAASGGITAGDQYTTTGVDVTATGGNSAPPPSVAVYAVGQQAGWMYGDPQASPQSYATGNPVTSSPGSAAWQQTGMLGSGGSNGWFLTANDTGFPPLSAGMSLGLWFSAGYFGSGTGVTISTNRYNLTGQPYSVITLAELATATAPVAVLQLDLSGHLILTTYNGGTGTSHTIYSSSDLRSNSWHHVMLTTNGSTWTVYLDGGLGASASGSGAGMTSAWTWLVINGDLGSSGGSALSAQQHGGNVAYSHAEVYPSVLPAWRVLARYCAAITGFGLLPAPQSVSVSTVNNSQAGSSYVPDGSIFDGNYGGTAGGSLTRSVYTFSGLAVAQAGSYTSGPSARATQAGFGQQHGGSNYFGDAVWVSWSGLAPSYGVYTAAAASGETSAATVSGTGESFSGGFGGSATGAGVSQTAAGSGASPPAAPSSLGDTVAQRMERILGYGGVTAPVRAIDANASLLVQAASDVGGQQAGASVQALVDSDNGLLYTGTDGALHYRSRTHLAADQAAGPAWSTGMNTAAGQQPFDASITYGNDPTQVFSSIAIQPYSPDGATLATITPANAAAANAAQQQHGVRPKTITSYLQDSSKIQAAANWWLANFGTIQRRVETVKVDAATHPAAWGLVLAANPGDIIQVYDAPFSAPATTGSYRIATISRVIAFGANGSQPEASATITAIPLPSSYWS